MDDEALINVDAEGVHGPRFGGRILGLFGAFTFVVGFALGGVIAPYWMFDPKKADEQPKDDPKKNQSALMISIGAQTVWAAPISGNDPIATGLSVEQVIGVYQEHAFSAGYDTEIEVARAGEAVEARLSFKARSHAQSGASLPPSTKNYPKSLVLVFEANQSPGTIVLAKVRQDGKEKSLGEVFVDLISFGGTKPELAQGQYLTSKGIFEIHDAETGPAAFIDGKQIYPIIEHEGLLPNLNPNAPSEAKSPNGNLLRIVGFEPSQGTFQNRLIMVETETGNHPCTARAIIIDVPRNKVHVLPNMLLNGNLGIQNAKNAFVLNGFCEAGLADTKTNTNYDLTATFNIQNGQIVFNRVPKTIAPPPTPKAPEVAQETAVSGAWRDISATRIASPIGAGGALLSLACRPGGGISLSVSGLPAPVNGTNGVVNFAGTSANMRYIPAANTYDLSISSDFANNGVLRALRAGGQIAISTAGISHNYTAPGSARINSLLNNCTAPIANNSQTTAAVPAKPVPPPTPRVQPTPPPTKAESKATAPTAPAPAKRKISTEAAANTPKPKN